MEKDSNFKSQPNPYTILNLILNTSMAVLSLIQSLNFAPTSSSFKSDNSVPVLALRKSKGFKWALIANSVALLYYLERFALNNSLMEEILPS